MMLTKAEVKYIQTLNEKKFRNQTNVFVAEGPKIINELLAAGNVQPLHVYATGEWLEKKELARYDFLSVETTLLTASELERVSSLSTPHQVLGIFRQPLFSDALTPSNTIVLLLDGIQDPGNFGTIIRIADWFGIGQVVAGRDCVDMFNAKVVQSTMGSIARVQVVYEDLGLYINRHQHIPLYASSLQGKSVSAFGTVQEGMLLIGNESKGIKKELLEFANYQVAIPGMGRAESLNAAVATGIILSHLVKVKDER